MAMAGSGGRPRRFSESQRQEVLRRVAAGESNRRIAAEVFGDARYRGRVERIRWAATRAARSGEPPLTPIEHTLDDAAPPADPAYWHELVAHGRRGLKERLARGENLSLRQLDTLLSLEVRVAKLETFERLQDMTRGG